MIRAVLIATTFLAALAVPRPAVARDDWLGRDKALHFTVSLTVAGAGSGVGARLSENLWLGVALGAGLAVGGRG